MAMTARPRAVVGPSEFICSSSETGRKLNAARLLAVVKSGLSDPPCNVNYGNSAKDIDGVGGSIRSMTLIQASREALIDRP